MLASNTSTIPISELANALEHPENFCGMHFFNPVHRMPLVEFVPQREKLRRNHRESCRLGEQDGQDADCG